MGSISEFLAMGGYAAYVWPAFGVAAVVLVGFVISTLRTLRARERALAARESADHAETGGERTA